MICKPPMGHIDFLSLVYFIDTMVTKNGTYLIRFLWENICGVFHRFWPVLSPLQYQRPQRPISNQNSFWLRNSKFLNVSPKVFVWLSYNALKMHTMMEEFLLLHVQHKPQSSLQTHHNLIPIILHQLAHGLIGREFTCQCTAIFRVWLLLSKMAC